MRARREESGFALILAILALMLLTFLGLTLAQTTSTELQIATNYRNAQQALYNAEAGMEVGRRVLRDLASGGAGGGAGAVLPGARGAGPYSAATPPSVPQTRTGRSGEASRNLENKDCDLAVYAGFGAVLDTANTDYPYQNVYQFLGQSLQGTFTVWVRRATLYDPLGVPYDDPNDSTLVMTVEGTAPYQQAGTNFTQRGRAVRVLEASLLLSSPCKAVGGQEKDNPGCE